MPVSAGKQIVLDVYSQGAAGFDLPGAAGVGMEQHAKEKTGRKGSESQCGHGIRCSKDHPDEAVIRSGYWGSSEDSLSLALAPRLSFLFFGVPARLLVPRPGLCFHKWEGVEVSRACETRIKGRGVPGSV
jgi:hypothetical protein